MQLISMFLQSLHIHYRVKKLQNGKEFKPAKQISCHSCQLQNLVKTWKFKLENKGKDLNKIYNAKEFTMAQAYSTSWVEITNW